MARKKQSLLEDLIDITSKFPWWVGVLLAAIAYFFLHAYASKEIASPLDMQHIGESFANNLLQTLARFGQYILPVVFLFGAALSAFNLLTRPKPHKSGATSLLGSNSPGSTKTFINTSCPKCGGKMVLRTAKRGVNVGSQFWGCSNYPKCRSTVALEK